MTLSWKDVNASLVVFLVALPLCLGIALASNAPLVSGLIAGIIGGIFVGIFGGSHVAVSGPAAGLTLVVAAAIVKLGSFELFCLAVMLAGLIQLALAIFQFEKLGEKIPISITKGLLSAIGLLICYNQLPNILGTTIELSSLSVFVSNLKMSTLLVSFVTAFIIIFWDNLRYQIKAVARIPSQLVAVVATAIVFSFITPLLGFSLQPEEFVVIPKEIIFSLGIEKLMLLSEINLNLIVVAVTVALIASTESLLSLNATKVIDPQQRPVHPRKELIAQGFANFLCGFFGGLPVTSVIVRSSANIESGGQTRWSAIMHGIWLLLFVLLAAPMLEKIPISTLAVILVFVGLKLISIEAIKSLFKSSVIEFYAYIFTVVAILSTDILKGVIAGIVFYYLTLLVDSKVRAK